MNDLSEKEHKLISRLDAIPKIRTMYILILIGVIICCWLYFVIRHPLFANPFVAINELKKGTYPKDIFMIIAAFFPVLFSLCWILILFAAAVGIGLLKQRNELLRIIKKLTHYNEDKAT